MTHIGRYEVLGVLGTGGFGKVFRAWDPAVKRLVAIKILNAEGDPQAIERFREEAGTTAKLVHKNIITIFELGEHEGNPFIAMELLDGKTLQQIISQMGSDTSAFPLLQRVEILAQIADGLHYAHEQGVIHRDIKPANVMCLPSKTVKILDFGIARAVGDLARLTQTNSVAGSILYMAPEQFRGVESDPLTDIFGFGSLCYELLCAEHPFAAADSTRVIARVSAAEPVPPRTVCPHIPVRLDDIVMRALAKNRVMRYQSVGDIALDLRSVLSDLCAERARILFRQSQTLYEQGCREESALAIVRTALDLDPSNLEIRAFRDQLQRSIQITAAKAQAASLIETADRLAGSRQFTEALELYEDALRLSDDDKSTVLDKLAAVKKKQESRRSSGRMVAEARQDLAAKHLTHAQELAQNAAIVDPENPDVPLLLQQIELSFQEEAKTRQLLASLAAIETLKPPQNFQQGLISLQELESEFGSRPEIQRTRERLSAAERTWGIQRAEELIAAENLPDAVEVLTKLAEAWPEDSSLESLLAQTRRQLEKAQREQAVNTAFAKAEHFRSTGQLDSAIAVMDECLTVYPEERRLSTFRATIHEELEAEKRELRIREGLQEATARMGVEQWSEAVLLLQKLTGELGSDPRILALVEEAGRKRAEAEEQAFLAETRAAFENLGSAQRWEDARKQIDVARQRYPEHPDLLLLYTRAGEELEREQQHRSEAAANVEQALREKDYVRAVELADSLWREFRSRDELLDLDLRAWKELRRAELRRFSEDVGRYLQGNNLKAADQYLSATASTFSGDPVWQLLRRETDKRRASDSQVFDFMQSGNVDATLDRPASLSDTDTTGGVTAGFQLPPSGKSRGAKGKKK